MEALWFIDDEAIEEEDGVIISCQAPTYTLIIEDLMAADGGVYQVLLEDGQGMIIFLSRLYFRLKIHFCCKSCGREIRPNPLFPD